MMIDNKQVMAKNIKLLMEEKNVTATDVCKALGFKHNTFSGWVNGKMYPRIDKIEMMANYFGVNKSALVEEHIFSLDYYSLSYDPEAEYIAEARAFYEKYLSADKKTRRIIDQLLEEGDE